MAVPTETWAGSKSGGAAVGEGGGQVFEHARAHGLVHGSGTVGHEHGARPGQRRLGNRSDEAFLVRDAQEMSITARMPWGGGVRAVMGVRLPPQKTRCESRNGCGPRSTSPPSCEQSVGQGTVTGNVDGTTTTESYPGYPRSSPAPARPVNQPVGASVTENPPAARIRSLAATSGVLCPTNAVTPPLGCRAKPVMG